MNGMLCKRNPGAVAGFAVPAAIFVIVVVSLLALGGLYVAQSDATANDGIRRSLKAFYAANAGATHVVATWDANAYAALSPGDSVDTGWRTLADGSQYRTVILRVDDGQAGSPSLYRLRTTGRPGPTSTAQRVIVTVVGTLSVSDVCCEGAVKSQGTLQVRGTGNVPKADGRDQTPTGWGGYCSSTAGDLPGIVIRDTTDVIINGKPKIYGSPPILGDSTIDDQDFGFYNDLVAMADKEFVGDQKLKGVGPVVSGGSCDTSVPTNWGDPLAPGGPCWGYLPIIHVTGNLRLSGNGYGQGLLLVDGDLTITGTFDFYGVIVVMGQADFGGTPRIVGGVLVRNGSGGTGVSQLRGNEGVHYSSCAANRSLTQATLARPLSGRYWFETIE